MAQYNNLTSLVNLKAGDIITYDTTTVIDFNKYKVKVELYGDKVGANAGGYTSFVIETSKLPQSILSFNNSVASIGGQRNDLIYGDSSDLYYRIAVAGNSGGNGKDLSGTRKGGAGGGNTGGDGGYKSSSYLYNGLGGTQTAGGKNNKYPNNTTYQGGFGFGGDSLYIHSTGYGGNGGYGWFGGGGGYAGPKPTFESGGGAGGSGFIIGVSTKIYPTGYLGDDTELQSIIASSISEGVLTRGISNEETPKMILTIIETVVTPNTNTSKFSYYNGTEFVSTDINYYDGTKFVLCDAYCYDGTQFKKI